MQVEQIDHLFNVLIVGDAATGKSSILYRLFDHFTNAYITTVLVDNKEKTIDVNGKKIKLNLYDLSPREEYSRVVSSLVGSDIDVNSYLADRYKEAHGILVVYDVTNQASFDHVSMFLDEISKHETNAGLGKPSILLVGNKADCSPRAVTTEAAEKLAQQKGLEVIETSAKDGTNVEAAFNKLTSNILQKLAGAL